MRPREREEVDHALCRRCGIVRTEHVSSPVEPDLMGIPCDNLHLCSDGSLRRRLDFTCVKTAGDLAMRAGPWASSMTRRFHEQVCRSK